MTQERLTLPKGAQQTLLLLALTCNKGLTKPEYKGTQQDLTNEKERLQGYAGQKGNQGKFVARIRITFTEKLY
jgi:hypothetical protein